MKKIILSLCMIFCYSSALATTLAIYNHGQTLVTESKKIEIPQGTNEIIYKDVAKTINPKTLQIETNNSNINILDMNYEYDLINTKSILDKYIGKKLTIIIPDFFDNEKNIKIEATLISNNDRPIFKFNDKIYLGDYQSLMVSQLPDNLRTRPTLVWLAKNKGKSINQDITVSYLCSGLKWDVDYVMYLDETNQKANLQGWATIENRTGKTFNKTKINLVAGDVNKVAPRYMQALRSEVLSKNVMDTQGGVQEKSVFEYHVYDLGRDIYLKDNQIKQVSLLSLPQVDYEKKIISKNRDFKTVEIRNKHPEVFVSFKNDKENGGGIPLPKGIIRTYQKSGGVKLFVGEDTINHTPKNEVVELKLGKSFDITIDRKVLDRRKVGQNVYEYTKEITIKNGKDIPEMVIIEETLPGNWEIVKSNFSYKKLNMTNISFESKIPAQGMNVYTYTVRTRY